MIDPRKIGQFLMGEWDKTSQPLKERASVLPLGQYEDGSVGLAWPGLLAAPAQGVANFGTYGYGEDAVPFNSRMAFDAAGGAMTGAVGVGALGGFADNAVGSAGGKLAQPQGIRAYHGTTADDFAKFEGEPWFSPDANFASSYATPDDDVMGRVYPVNMNFKNPLKVSADDYDANWQSLGVTDPLEFDYDLATAARAKGYDGLIYDMGLDAPPQYQAIAPGTVYSATTGDLLYSNAPTGAAIPMGMEAQGQDTDPALLEYLKAVGLY